MVRMNTTARGPLPTLPVNTTPPTISGTATIGQTLTRTPGVWAGWPWPSTVEGQWIRGASTVIAGATGPTYVIQAADQASTVKYRETSINGAGSATATSAPTTTIP